MLSKQKICRLMTECSRKTLSQTLKNQKWVTKRLPMTTIEIVHREPLKRDFYGCKSIYSVAASKQGHALLLNSL